MQLRDLEARFVRRELRECPRGGGGAECCIVHAEPRVHEYHVTVESIAEADGVRFLCPKCFAEHPDGVGVHSVLCWRPRVPADVDPKPGRWEFEGTGLDDLTLRAGSSSILLIGGCNAHFFIEAGAIRF